MVKNLILILFILVIVSRSSNCQEKRFPEDKNFLSKYDFRNENGFLKNYNFIKGNINADSTENKIRKSTVQKTNIGGIFLSPSIGVSFPFGQFGNYSRAGVIYGIKAELAYIKLFPFVFGFVYEYQKNPGDGDYMTSNFLTKYDTKITSLGGSLDIILSKYLISDFTTPVFSLEIKYANIIKDVTTTSGAAFDVRGSSSLLTYSFGLGVTVYVFDIGGKYTIAGDYSGLEILGRFHFPLFKF
jgi:hypothetical protein